MTTNNSFFNIITRSKLGERLDQKVGDEKVAASIINGTILDEAEQFSSSMRTPIETSVGTIVAANVTSIVPHTPVEYHMDHKTMCRFLGVTHMTLGWKSYAPHFVSFLLNKNGESFTYDILSTLSDAEQKQLLAAWGKNINKMRHVLLKAQTELGGQLFQVLMMGFIDPDSSEVKNDGLGKGQQTNINIHCNSLLMPKVEEFDHGKHLNGSLERVTPEEFGSIASEAEKLKMEDPMTVYVMKHLGHLLQKQFEEVLPTGTFTKITKEKTPKTNGHFFNGWDVHFSEKILFSEVIQALYTGYMELQEEWISLRDAYREKNLDVIRHKFPKEIMEFVENLKPTEAMKQRYGFEGSVAKAGMNISAKPSFAFRFFFEEEHGELYVRDLIIAPSFSQQKGSIESILGGLLRMK